MIAAVQLQGVDDATFASSIAELRRLAMTLGLDIVGMVTQRRGKMAPGQMFGDGKLLELAAWTGGGGVIEGYKKPGTPKRRPDKVKAEEDEEDKGGRGGRKMVVGGGGGGGGGVLGVILDSVLNVNIQDF